MSLEMAKKAVQFVWDNKGDNSKISITFFGGEPMLEYDTIIKPLVNWAESTDMNIKWGMTTNGTLFTEERLNWLKENNVGFLLSIDGDKKTQDYNRPCANGKSSFDLINPMLSKILNNFPGTTFRSTAIPESSNNIIDNYLFARKTGFKNYYIMPNVMESWTQEQIDNYNYQIGIIYQILYRDVTLGIEPLAINNLIKTYQLFFEPEKEPCLKDCYRCGLGTTSIGIGTDGSIWGCQEHATYKEKDIFYIGNIETGIDANRHINLLKSFCETNYIIPEEEGMCDTCMRKKWCRNVHCPSHNLINFNNIRKQDKMTCQYRKFEDSMALKLLDQAEKEHNQLFFNYIQEELNKARGKQYAM
jgi:radical SAM protein with 4Fe4S-binding SPASM domain